ncbi:hypothetical protein QBC42DRAFT_221232 [Cladorrhinum samala]|uniref:Uncharacterized protein n=1 Tax=Cladorrhinum samala TaxID=585594 RepID=A0AAV9HVI5_9PEZI|nr:hypothetical protein QBC42DRAFT_221232 [Cladorrhinum samala]
MDILFSPYGAGAMPKSAMDEIEQKTEELLRSSSFQQMLELENKYKMERLQGAQLPPPASPTLSEGYGALSSQQQHYADSLAQQHKSLMLKAVRGNGSLPTLSITIPQKEQEEEPEAVTPTNADSFQKQVKFLAPDNDYNDDEDRMSEQSSICQSPSWENYGQKKKDKKLEAERRKKEKAQAEKEAKAAKKRNGSRLSKLQPSAAAPSHDSRTAPAFAQPERSMSDPVFVVQHIPPRQQDFGRAASSDNLQQGRQYPQAVSEVLNGNVDQRYTLRRSMSEGPMLPIQPPQQPHAPNPCPPSASRTPMLRRMSPSRHSRSNSGNLLQTSSSHRSQEPLPVVSVVTADRRDGYVRYQRAQSTERALAGLADEELLGDPNSYSSSTATSRNAFPTRRSSLTQEARLAAMKLVSGRTSSAIKDSTSSTQSDYFAFSAQPYSACNADTPAPIMVSHIEKPTVDRPHTSQSSASFGARSSSSSVTSTQSKKNRSLKDTAKAVLNISNSPKPASAVSLPPYYAIRARLQSRPSAYAESNTPPSPASVSQETTDPAHITSANIGKAPEMTTQAGSRVSEGSSSSSACEDGSPLPSPSTTPDTSRPQSAKDVPFATTELKKSDVQDDQRTLRESLESSDSTTPRAEESAASNTPQAASEDQWSRTALPIEIDCDAQSSTTSSSNLEDIKDDSPTTISETSAKSQAISSARETKKQVDLVISIPPRSKRRTQLVTSPTQVSPSNQEPQSDHETRPRSSEKANRKQKRQLKLQAPAEELTSSSSSTVISSGPASPTGGGIPTLSPQFQIPSNPYMEDCPELAAQQEPESVPRALAAASSVSLPASRTPSVSSKPLAPPRTNSAPLLSAAASQASSTRKSILKQPKVLPPDGSVTPVLSALPKHMQQLQSRHGQQPPPSPVAAAGSPLAKMFVECCSCKFYHDMPSKIYECMAKPDAVIEDRNLGISGAITTMVKCPWCNHNMSMNCCAGYAAVVYLKEKLH